MAGPTPSPQTVTISEDDTWAHNPAVGKSNVCINVRTSPAQASISATLDGPSGYHPHLDKTPLDKSGSIQIESEITQAGDYTKSQGSRTRATPLTTATNTITNRDRNRLFMATTSSFASLGFCNANVCPCTGDEGADASSVWVSSL